MFGLALKTSHMPHSHTHTNTNTHTHTCTATTHTCTRPVRFCYTPMFKKLLRLVESQSISGITFADVMLEAGKEINALLETDWRNVSVETLGGGSGSGGAIKLDNRSGILVFWLCTDMTLQYL